MTRLRLAAVEADGSLLEQDTESINELMADMATGAAEVAPSDGYASGTVGQYQSALKAFYRYHDGHEVDPEAIPVFAPDDTTVEERDMFTVDEIQAMRDAIESARERCLFELLAYTGQRIRVIQTLRVKDVNLAEGVLYINETSDGLKGAQGKRPLLGAEEYVRQWLNYHPTNEPTDYLITPKATGGGTPGDMITQDTIRYHLRKIADKSEVNKDVHPHIFRHYFTTIAKRDYGMDDAYIKKLRGDAPGSNVMETTYRHLSDADAVEHATAKYRGEEPEQQDSPMTPDTCPTCSVTLSPGAKSCERCGSVFTPDARAARDTVTDEASQAKESADSVEEFKLLDQLEQVARDNPERAAEVLGDLLAD
ncbi:MAG: tyrosine-type recombinase/integrase [Salinirussus sp.]